ncbi:Vitamin D3 receptor [Terramyces sp. JEL0728]|nr:Vitamin D3 receptor [Terramyces sp. JEL0728]
MQFLTTVSILISVISAAPASTPGSPNTGCIALHCGIQSLGCEFDSGCKKVLDCSQACPSGNLTCSERCVTEYGTAKFDTLTVCIQNNNCITPYPHKSYTTPSTSFAFTLDQFVGKWYALYGLDPGLDYYDYQTMTISSLGGGNYNHELQIAFPEGVKTINSTFTSQTVGHFGLDYSLGGGGHDDWYILGLTNDLLLVEYLGANKLSNYQGGYVLRRDSSAPLTAAETSQISAALSSSGSQLAFSQFYALKSQ